MAAKEGREFDYCFKVIIVGEYKVGKSSLLCRYTEKNFVNSLDSTVGVDFRMKILDREDKKIKLQIWDTGGNERFRTQTNSFYRGAKGVLLVYDITNRHSFDNIGYWIEAMHRCCGYPNPYAILVGNKCHLNQFREVSTEEGEQYARSHDLFFYETSAENNTNVTNCFEQLVTGMIAAEDMRNISKVSSDLWPLDNSVKLATNDANNARQQTDCKCI